MPLSIVQLSPLSVRVTGWLTVTLATLGAAVCAGAVDTKRAERARNAELKTSRDLDMSQPFKTIGGGVVLEHEEESAKDVE
jgi:hypothetical protein